MHDREDLKCHGLPIVAHPRRPLIPLSVLISFSFSQSLSYSCSFSRRQSSISAIKNGKRAIMLPFGDLIRCRVCGLVGSYQRHCVVTLALGLTCSPCAPLDAGATVAVSSCAAAIVLRPLLCEGQAPFACAENTSDRLTTQIAACRDLWETTKQVC